jgi:hypothetical protein
MRESGFYWAKMQGEEWDGWVLVLHKNSRQGGRASWFVIDPASRGYKHFWEEADFSEIHPERIISPLS